ncbi:MAG: hypothetical protein GXP37_14860 [Chloroflexi bacterium]|nr:hypothetical protein [Chloroflexota bacterium]
MSLAAWRDIALVFLILQAFVLALIPGALLFFANKGLRQAIQWLRNRGLPEAQRYSRLVADKAQSTTQQIIGPVILADAQLTRIKHTPASLMRALRRRQRRFYV